MNEEQKIQNTETNKLKNEINNGTKDKHRVIISKEAKRALDEILTRANDGFDAGDISKSDVVEMLIFNASKYITDSEINELRVQHFDEVKVLAAILKGVAKGDQVPEALKVQLRNQYGLTESHKRKFAMTGRTRSNKTCSTILPDIE